jgi:hypothetical protein
MAKNLSFKTYNRPNKYFKRSTKDSKRYEKTPPEGFIKPPEKVKEISQGTEITKSLEKK